MSGFVGKAATTALRQCARVLTVEANPSKDADPDLPILQQAKAEYAKLQ
jgi:hypothetical protein